MFKYLLIPILGIIFTVGVAMAEEPATAVTADADVTQVVVANAVTEENLGIAEELCVQDYSDLIKRIIKVDRGDSERGTKKLLSRLKTACNETEIDLIVQELKTRKTDDVQELVLDTYEEVNDDQDYQVRLLRVMGSYEDAIKEMFKALDSIHPKVVSFAARSLMEQLKELDEDDVEEVYKKADDKDKIFIVKILIRKLNDKYVRIYIEACKNGSPEVRKVAVNKLSEKLNRLNVSIVYYVFVAATPEQKLSILKQINATSWRSMFMPAVKLGMKEDDQKIKKIAREILERVDPISVLDF